MNSHARHPGRIALAIVIAGAVIAVALLSSSPFASQRTVTSTNTMTNTITETVSGAASLTVTEVVVSNRTVTVNMTEAQPYALIVNANATVSGQAVSIPGCAVHGDCTSAANQSSTAVLILYNGNYYYVSNYTFTSVNQPNLVYTIWYTNSTEFCISPAVSWDPVCPNAAFLLENPTQSQTTTTSCPVSGGGGPVYLDIVTDQGQPVPDQQIQVVQTGPSVDGRPCGTASLPTLVTNSTGWAQVPGAGSLPYAGSLAVSFVYSGQTYNGTVTIYPMTTTYVTFYVPSGNVASTNCEFNSCPTYTDSMTMGGGKCLFHCGGLMYSTQEVAY